MNLPRLQKGPLDQQLSAAEFNGAMQRLADLEDRAQELRALLQPVRPNPVPGTATQTVVVVREPVSSDKELSVRAVRYITNPPEPCAESGGEVGCHIEWAGVEFAAFPEFGRTVMDYSEAFWNGEDTGFDDTTRFLIARRMDVYQWVVGLPSNEVKVSQFAYVTNPIINAPLVEVQPVKFDAELQVPAWVDDGPRVTIRVVPGFKGDHFVQIAAQSPRAYVRLDYIGGQWITSPEWRFGVRAFDVTTPRGECPQ